MLPGRRMPRAAVCGAACVAACATGTPVETGPTAHAPHKVDSLPSAVAAAPVSQSAPNAVAPAPASAAIATPADPFARLDGLLIPSPNRYRSASGQPGPDYWQQRADYTIAVTLDTSTRTVSGRVAIVYTNNSPDSLTFVWLQLDQNLYRPGSIGSMVNADEARWGARGFRGGYDIRDLAVNGRPVLPTVDDTRMRVKLPAPIPPRGGHVTISMEYRFSVPDHGSDRMGRDGQLYEIAQWYPRMAVYDDVRAWNTEPYAGQGEFYLEYGDFEYAVTVPAGYVVAGSGVLQNPQDVLTAAQRARLAEAARSDRVVSVIAAGEDSALPRAGTRTWRFRASSVRDVAWAGAPDFRWDATSWHGVLLQAFYERAKAGEAWEHGADWTRWSIRFYSQLVQPYPYPQATSVAGPVGGMEYPMLVMVHYGKAATDREAVFGTIDHEQGHEWFPMVVGSNERQYAWMDEGFDTYMNAFSREAHGADTTCWTEYLAEWRMAVMSGTQSPLMTPADRIDPGAYGAIGYRKPGAVLLALRDHVVGREAFDDAFREYASRWSFKHPMPADFFRTVENVSGQDLAWFWRGFFFSDDVLDIGIDTVATVATRGGLRAMVRLTKHTSIPFPVEMRLKLEGGATQDVRLPVEIWTAGDHYVAVIPVDARVVGARLWPDPTVPDWQHDNDVWGDAPPTQRASGVTAGGLASPLNISP